MILLHSELFSCTQEKISQSQKIKQNHKPQVKSTFKAPTYSVSYFCQLLSTNPGCVAMWECRQVSRQSLQFTSTIESWQPNARASLTRLTKLRSYTCKRLTLSLPYLHTCNSHQCVCCLIQIKEWTTINDITVRKLVKSLCY